MYIEFQGYSLSTWLDFSSEKAVGWQLCKLEGEWPSKKEGLAMRGEHSKKKHDEKGEKLKTQMIRVTWARMLLKPVFHFVKDYLMAFPWGLISMGSVQAHSPLLYQSWLKAKILQHSWVYIRSVCVKLRMSSLELQSTSANAGAPACKLQ